MHPDATPQRPSWPATPPPAPLDAEALARYERLSREERQRVARLISLSGAPLALAIAAVEALRTE